MRIQSNFAEPKDSGNAPSEAPEPDYLQRFLQRQREGRRARLVLDLETRLRNPWRDSNGREGALEAWG